MSIVMTANNSGRGYINNMETTLRVGGMSCGHCEGRVRKALAQIPGVEVLEVSHKHSRARVKHDGNLDVSRVKAAIEEAGYSFDGESADSDNGGSSSKAQDEGDDEEDDHQGASALFYISGMTCATCAIRVERAIGEVPGVSAAAVNFARGTARVKVFPGFDYKKIEESVSRAGYSAKFGAKLDIAAIRTDETKQARARLALATILGAPVVVFGMAHLQHGFWGIAQLVLASIVVFVPGGIFFAAALKNLRHATATMDTLVALGSGAAWAFSAVGLFSGRELYFEVAVSIIALILLGRFLESRAKSSASRAIEELAALGARVALKLVGDSPKEVPIEELNRGDLFLARAGDRIAVDGVVVGGESAIDESMLTGESVPAYKKQGDKVVGGTINKEGSLTIRATEVGAGTVLARVLRLVEEAQASKAPIQRLADKVAAVFVPAVLAVAIATGVAWYLFAADHSISRAIFTSVAVLVIACPCAMGLATPTAVMVATGKAARRGILIKDAASLERAATVSCVFFDKTGTLTEGKPEVVEVRALKNGAGGSMPESEIVRLVASLEAHSQHPLAQGIVSYAKTRKLDLINPSSFRSFPGRGVSGTLNGSAVAVGTIGLMEELGYVAPESAEISHELAEHGQTPIVVATEGRPVGIIGMLDAPRKSGPTAIAALGQMGLQVHLLTGDRDAIARAIGARLGFDISSIHSEVLPEQKAQVAQSFRTLGYVVAMVGDGINDAPALVSADVGIAMGGGADVALEAAPIVLMRQDPMLVAEAISIARQGLRTIKQNLFWAFGYNAIAIPLAAAGFLSPMIAAGAMALSSVSVVANSLRLRWAP